MRTIGRQRFPYLSKKEREIVELFIQAGVKRNVAQALMYLNSVDEAASREIERGADLRQPEVSTALQYISQQKWVHTREARYESRGRPIRFYKLAVPINEILDTIIQMKKDDVQQQIDTIEEIRCRISKKRT